MIGQDLNTLVNSDVIQACSPPPDPKLFPEGIDTPWCKPGRAVWRYVDGGENRDDKVAEVKLFSKLAGELGFEYNVVEGFWSKFTDEQLSDVVELFAASSMSGCWCGMHSKQSARPASAPRSSSTAATKFGIAGAKIDFFDHEAKEVIDLYQAMLQRGGGEAPGAGFPRRQQARRRAADLAQRAHARSDPRHGKPHLQPRNA